MIRIKPEQDVTKRKAGVFRVNNLFHSSVFHIILSVCVCVCVCVHPSRLLSSLIFERSVLKRGGGGDVMTIMVRSSHVGYIVFTS